MSNPLCQSRLAQVADEIFENKEVAVIPVALILFCSVPMSHARWDQGCMEKIYNRATPSNIMSNFYACCFIIIS